MIGGVTENCPKVLRELGKLYADIDSVRVLDTLPDVNKIRHKYGLEPILETDNFVQTMIETEAAIPEETD